MQITITTLHLPQSTEAKEYVAKKIERLGKFYPSIKIIEVRLIGKKSHRGQENDYYCELTIGLPKKVLEIVDVEREIEKAIDKALERAKRVLVKTKEKKVSEKHWAALTEKQKRGSKAS